MFVCFQLLDFIIPPKQLLKGTKCFIWKEAQKVDYNHWKNRYLMKNECMVPPVTRYENSSKAWKPFCHVCLLPLRIVPAKTCSSFAQMGNLYSYVNLGQDLMTQPSKPSTPPSTGRSEQQTNISVACLQEEAQTDMLSPAFRQDK